MTPSLPSSLKQAATIHRRLSVAEVRVRLAVRFVREFDFRVEKRVRRLVVSGDTLFGRGKRILGFPAFEARSPSPSLLIPNLWPALLSCLQTLLFHYSIRQTREEGEHVDPPTLCLQSLQWMQRHASRSSLHSLPVCPVLLLSLLLTCSRPSPRLRPQEGK